MSGSTCSFWADLTPFSLKGMLNTVDRRLRGGTGTSLPNWYRVVDISQGEYKDGDGNRIDADGKPWQAKVAADWLQRDQRRCYVAAGPDEHGGGGGTFVPYGQDVLAKLAGFLATDEAEATLCRIDAEDAARTLDRKTRLASNRAAKEAERAARRDERAAGLAKTQRSQVPLSPTPYTDAEVSF
jgi:hypothetical protein